MIRVCLSCKFYRLQDLRSGLCRVDRDVIPVTSYPEMLHDDSCDRWQDAGQRYYIRLGWLKDQRQ